MISDSSSSEPIYSDDQRWEQWEEQFQNRLNALIERVSGGKKIEDKCLMPSYEDDDLDGAEHRQIQQ